MEFKDYYTTLGVEPTAGEAEIKTAYRRLARKYHPDVSKEADAEDRFKAVNEAYEVLRDPEKRKAYDQLRAQGYRPGEEFNPPPAGAGGRYYSYGNSGNFDAEDIFGNVGPGGTGFSDFFESLFNRGRGARASARPDVPGDTRARLAVPLQTVYRGDSLRITINGRQLDVKVPKGIRPGQSIRLAGQGSHGGNLLLQVEYAPHPQFEVDDRNILYTLELTPWQAALGTSIGVPTLGGTVELKIPAGSDAGRRLRLRGRGLPGTTPGDQIVELEINAPVPANDAQRKAYVQLQQAFEGRKAAES